VSSNSRWSKTPKTLEKRVLEDSNPRPSGLVARKNVEFTGFFGHEIASVFKKSSKVTKNI